MQKDSDADNRRFATRVELPPPPPMEPIPLAQPLTDLGRNAPQKRRMVAKELPKKRQYPAPSVRFKFPILRQNRAYPYNPQTRSLRNQRVTPIIPRRPGPTIPKISQPPNSNPYPPRSNLDLSNISSRRDFEATRKNPSQIIEERKPRVQFAEPPKHEQEIVEKMIIPEIPDFSKKSGVFFDNVMNIPRKTTTEKPQPGSQFDPEVKFQSNDELRRFVTFSIKSLYTHRRKKRHGWYVHHHKGFSFEVDEKNQKRMKRNAEYDTFTMTVKAPNGEQHTFTSDELLTDSFIGIEKGKRRKYENPVSKFTGVSWCNQNDRWKVVVQGKNLDTGRKMNRQIGVFPVSNEVEAAYVFDIARIKSGKPPQNFKSRDHYLDTLKAYKRPMSAKYKEQNVALIQSWGKRLFEHSELEAILPPNTKIRYSRTQAT